MKGSGSLGFRAFFVGLAKAWRPKVCRTIAFYGCWASILHALAGGGAG